MTTVKKVAFWGCLSLVASVMVVIYGVVFLAVSLMAFVAPVIRYALLTLWLLWRFLTSHGWFLTREQVMNSPGNRPNNRQGYSPAEG